MSYIKKIRIKNFKNLENVEIEVKPLTFLFGPNGSGKSSFIKAMMFLSKNLFPLNTGKTVYKISNEVDLGSYEDIVINNKTDKNIVFEFDLEGEFDFPNIDVFEPERYRDNPKLYELSTELINRPFFNVFEKNFFLLRRRNVDANSFFITQKFSLKYIVEFSFLEKHKNLLSIQIVDKINNSNYLLSKNDIMDDTDPIVYTKEGFSFLGNDNISNLFNRYLGHIEERDIITHAPDEEILLEQHFNLNRIDSLSTVLSKEYNYITPAFRAKEILSEEWEAYSKKEKIKFFYEVLKFCYLSADLAPKILSEFLGYQHLPLTREVPKKLYLIERNEFDENEYYKLLNILYKDKSPTSISQNINYYLTKLGFNLKFDINIVGQIGEIYFLKEDNLKINFSNASSGLIQVFPVISFCCIASFYGEVYNIFTPSIVEFLSSTLITPLDPVKLDLIFIEQPELHLHPRLQSMLAELFSDTIKISDNNLFIETHSEHLIRKIQVLIAKGELDREKVAVYYFDNTEGSTKIKKMEIEENGFFKEPWPNGFFDESYNLSKELLFPNKN